MVLKIVQYGEKVLHEIGKPISEFDGKLKKLFEDMVETMIDAEGIGLAAQQIGKALQFCVVDLRGMDPEYEYELDGTTPPVDLFMPIGMCNPKIDFLESEDLPYEEGCLSFPEIRGDVVRPDLIRCSYQDVDGTPHVIVCDDLLGRCIQHEVDHLNGILFTDRMKKRVIKKIQQPINDLKAKTLRELKS